MPTGFRRSAERSARILLTYFHPWTLTPQDATEHVPHVNDLGKRNEWVQRCNTWLQGRILTEEMRRIVTHVARVTSIRPKESNDMAGDSEDEISDREVDVCEEDLEMVLQTNPGGRFKNDTKDAPAVVALRFVENVGEKTLENEQLATQTANAYKQVEHYTTPQSSTTH